ncbi:MAG TPA: DNA primase [Nitrospinaceae bacterium]|jgi:replicative DNA helicase|nr:DNA primase [Nitrospinaceae bacterium]
MQRTEEVILKNLIYDEKYTRKVLPFLKGDYFAEKEDRLLFEQINEFINKYNNLPTKEALIIEFDNRNIKDDDFDGVTGLLAKLEKNEEETDINWLLDTTERFCQDKAIYNAVVASIGILDESKSNTQEKGAIPELLTDALSVSFDPHVGHDYFLDSDDRFDSYHKSEKKIPFDLDYFNKVTKGGFSVKTLNIILAGTGVGKSLIMCHMASACLSQGRNVLYITLEMSEEKIAERIDANLLNIDLNDLNVLSKQMYESKIENLKKTTKGRLIVKEYPTAAANVNHFRALINELNLKRNFKADIIYVDYINICSSSRIKAGAYVNSYSYIKSIAEELRGLAVESGIPIVSATQTTRSGFTNTDVGLEDTSESFGLPATADFMCAAISTEKLEEVGQILIKQLKNRYSDPTKNKKFVIGIDRAKMKLYDLDPSEQKSLVDTGQDEDNKDSAPVYDKFKKKDFSDFKIT